MRSLSERLAYTCPIAIVRFDSDFSQVYPDLAIPKTGATKMIEIDPVNKDRPNTERDVFSVRGTFTVVKQINLAAPEVGRFDLHIPLADEPRWDPICRRLDILVPRAGEDAPMFVTVLPPNRKRVLDGEFWGPFTAKDVEGVRQLTEFLLKTPIKAIRTHEAEEFLRSSNPWMVALGIAALDELGVLQSKHFTSAVAAVPEGYVTEFVSEALAYVEKPWVRDGLTEQFSHMMTTESPEKQIRILTYLDGRMTTNPASFGRAVGIVELRRAARDYLPLAARDPKRAKVVVALEEFLTAKAHPIALRSFMKLIDRLEDRVAFSEAPDLVKKALATRVARCRAVFREGELEPGWLELVAFNHEVAGLAAKGSIDRHLTAALEADTRDIATVLIGVFGLDPKRVVEKAKKAADDKVRDKPDR